MTMTPEQQADYDRMLSENRDALDRIRDAGQWEEIVRCMNHHDPDALRDALNEVGLL